MVAIVRTLRGYLSSVAFLTLCLIGCDSGGGSGGLVYTGATLQATITEANGEKLATQAFEGGQTGGSVSFATLDGGGDSGKPLTIALYKTLSTAVNEVDAATRTDPGIAKALIAVNETMIGSCGGDASFSVTFDDVLLSFDGTLTFNDYCEDQTTLSGSATFSGQFVDPVTGFGNINLSFNTLTVSSGTESQTVSGDVTISLSATSESVTMDIVVRDDTTNDVFWVNNFSLTVTAGAGFEDIQLSGRFYDPVEGYVELSTPIALRTLDVDDYPSSGTLVATGVNGDVTVTALPGAAYQVDIDIGSDGIVEVTVVGSWTDSA